MEQPGNAAVGQAAAGASRQVGLTGRLPQSATCGLFPVSPADLHSSFTCKVPWDDPAAHSQQRSWGSSIADGMQASLWPWDKCHHGQLSQTQLLQLWHQDLPPIRCG